MFEFLRDTGADILRYLPSYLAEDPHFKAVQLALNTEHEKQRQLLIDIAKQFFVDTATWGLDDWERIYGIEKNSGSTYDERRSVIKSKILGIGTITNYMMNYLINQFVPAKDARFVENVTPGTFRIEVQNSYNADKIKNTVEIYKPAHLGYTLALASSSDMGLYAGGVVQTYENITVGPVIDGIPSVDDTEVYAGGVIQSYSVINV